MMIVGLLAFAMTPTAGASTTSTQAPTPSAVVHFRAAVEAAQKQDCGTALKEVSPIVDGETKGLPGQFLASAYDIAIYCNARANNSEKAGRYARRATALTEASDMAWSARLSADYFAHRYPQAIETLEAMTQGRGAALNGLNQRLIWGLNIALAKAKLTSLRKRLLLIVTASSYDPVDPSFFLDDSRGSAQASLASILLTEGDRAGALKLLAGLTSVSPILGVMFNPDLRAASPSLPDLRVAAEADLSRVRDLRSRFPDSLQPVIAEANTLRQLGRPVEAIAALEAARGRITSDTPFADQGEQLPWWWNELGYAHSMAGNYQATVTSFTSGAALDEGGMPNVSQVINLGSQQIAFGKYDDALRTVSSEFMKRKMSPFGRMQALSVRGCALALSGKTSEAQAVLQEAIAHENDDVAAVTDLLLCSGDDVGASASLVRRLSDELQRRGVVKELARYADPVPQEPSDPRQVRRARVAQRPEVQKALAAAGGAVNIPIQRTSLAW